MTKATIIAELMFEADLTKRKATQVYDKYKRMGALTKLEAAIITHNIKEVV